MAEFSIALSVTVAVLGVALVGFEAASLGALIKGSVALRRSLRASSQDFGSVLLKSPLVPGVSVVLAAADDSAETRARVRRLLDLHFGRHELVLVLDGPSQVELDAWTLELHLSRLEREGPDGFPTAAIRGYYVSSDPIRLLVVDKERGGVADALNAGVNAAKYPVIGLVDSEADFIPEFLLRLIRPMLEDWARTVAVCGVSLPAPATGLAGCIGGIESVRLWLVRCASFSASNKLLPVPGACMLVQRDAIRSIGGFRGGPLELFLDLHAATRVKASDWRIALVASPVSFRPAAGTWGDLRRQLRTDQQQLRAAGQFAGLNCVRGVLPLLETVAYVVAVTGWILGMLPGALAGLMFVVGVGGEIVISMTAVVLRELAEPGGIAPGRIAALFLSAIPENLGYRQVRNLWMIAGYFGAPVIPTKTVH